MEFHLADLFELAVDAFGDREYLVAGRERRTYDEMEARANRLGHHLAAAGVGPGDHVGIYGYNSAEWVEAIWACMKIRSVWVNINYRYVEDELRYLFANADLKALILQREFGPRVASVRDELTKLAHAIVIDDGSGASLAGLDALDYEQALATGSPERDFGPRSPDDIYLLFTGGTTGMPKGVVWRHEDVFYALGGGIDMRTGEKVTRPEQMAEKGRAGAITFLPIAPLMHGATQWAVMGQSFTGNKIVLVAHFDPDEVWRLVEREKVNAIMITGDAMGRPLIEALDAPGASYDTSSFLALSSSAAIFSPTVKDDFFRHFPHLVITDAIGSSETGGNGLTVVTPETTAMKGGGPTVTVGDGTAVLDEHLRPVEPGSGQIGRLARTGHIPIGYYNDPKKTAETFVEVDGVRWAMPGDYASVEADGTVTLLGRGSVCINSGGEKIFPEEVEAAVKSHPDVWDVIVIGVADERWGQRVAAIVEPRPGSAPDLESIQKHCREHIAGYKVPRQLHLVAEIVRSPSGKPDYRWATTLVAAPDS